jgi:serine/threonine protein kinase
MLVGELSDQETSSVADHLAGCAGCREAIRDLESADSVAKAALLYGVAGANAQDRDTVSGVTGKDTLAGADNVPLPAEAPADPFIARLIDELKRAAPTDEGRTEAWRPAADPADRAFPFLRPAAAPDELGRLGPYRILKVLGQGGMGVVFQAHDARLNRVCALKVMRPEVAGRPGMKDRFLREAQAAAAIDSDYVIPIFQVDEDQGAPYIAMPFLKGYSLEDWLGKRQERKPGSTLKPQVILQLGREIARGLAAAHALGVVHRDIKPANIWLDSTVHGRATILDFGLARLSEGVGEQHLTQAGMILGTPSYMAPEQARGQPLDARADLFSLGVVLYRLCTGVLPFQGVDTLSTLTALATHNPVPPAEINPRVPRPLSDLVMRLLAKDREWRTASAEELLGDLQRVVQALSGDRGRATERPSDAPASEDAAGPSRPLPLEAASKARPRPRFSRAWHWIKAHPGVTVLGAVVAGLLAMITFLGIHTSFQGLLCFFLIVGFCGIVALYIYKETT